MNKLKFNFVAAVQADPDASPATEATAATLTIKNLDKEDGNSTGVIFTGTTDADTNLDSNELIFGNSNFSAKFDLSTVADISDLNEIGNSKNLTVTGNVNSGYSISFDE